MTSIKFRLISVLAVLSLVFVSTPQIALAHVQASNNGVSAVMHILPDDDPVAREDTTILFTFGSETNSFSLATCGCKLTVNSGTSQQVSSNPIRAIGKQRANGQATVRFPEAGVYKLLLSGTTNTAKQFTITYFVSVNPAGEASNLTGGLTVLLVSLATLVILGIIAYHVISEGARYTATKPKEKK